MKCYSCINEEATVYLKVGKIIFMFCNSCYKKYQDKKCNILTSNKK